MTQKLAVRAFPLRVRSTTASIRRRLRAGSFARLPEVVMRTFFSRIASRRASKNSSMSDQIALTSEGGRFQFSVENAYIEIAGIFSVMQKSIKRSRASPPARWPSERESPRAAAQRPLPSRMMATWAGMRSAFNLPRAVVRLRSDFLRDMRRCWDGASGVETKKRAAGAARPTPGFYPGETRVVNVGRFGYVRWSGYLVLWRRPGPRLS